MIRPVQFRVEAQADVRLAMAWYAERSAQAAAGFRAQLAEAVALIQSAPEAFPPRYRGVRRAGLRRYPTVSPLGLRLAVIDVIAVLHGHQHSRRCVVELKPNMDLQLQPKSCPLEWPALRPAADTQR